MDDLQMKKFLEAVWETMTDYYEKKVKFENPEIIFNKNQKDLFFKKFENEYYSLLNGYMKNSCPGLDRHKQTAILIKSIVDENLFTAPNKNGKIFIGCEQIALIIGIYYMLTELNKALADKGVNQKITQYVFPNALACNTKYFDILTRDLYFQKHDNNSVYVLLVSHILFLIEYLTLKENGITPEILSE